MITIEDIRAMEDRLDNHPAIWTANGLYKVRWSKDFTQCTDAGSAYEADRLIYQYNKMRCDYTRQR